MEYKGVFESSDDFSKREGRQFSNLRDGSPKELRGIQCIYINMKSEYHLYKWLTSPSLSKRRKMPFPNT